MRKPSNIESLYIDFDCFFASVEQQLVPKYRDRPMGVLPLDSEYSGFIAVSREAKAMGIGRGARPVDLRETYPNFPAAVARHDVYIKVHQRILKTMKKILPVHKVWSIDEVECKLMGREREQWQEIAAQVRIKLASDIGPYITPSIGFGPNQVLAKIAAEMDKPNGLICLHPDQLPEALYGIDLSDIPGIGRRMAKRLGAANICTVQQLMGLSGKQMRSLWRSVEGERLWAGLHGYSVEKPQTQKRMFGHGRILSPDWRNRIGVRNCARLLLVKAARRLRRSGFAAGKMSLSIGFSNKTRRRAEHKLCVPAIDDQSLLTGLEELLTKLWQKTPNARPFKVSICLSDIVHLHERCEDLLETAAARRRRRRWEGISMLVDATNNHYARTMISIGTHIEPPGGYTGGKIAFGRIPDMEDFI